MIADMRFFPRMPQGAFGENCDFVGIPADAQCMEWRNIGMMEWWNGGKRRETESSQRKQDSEWIAAKNA
jgi:hypothetical protein